MQPWIEINVVALHRVHTGLFTFSIETNSGSPSFSEPTWCMTPIIFPPSDRHGKTLPTKTVILNAVVTMTQLMSVKLAAEYVLFCLLILIVCSSVYTLCLDVSCVGLCYINN